MTLPKGAFTQELFLRFLRGLNAKRKDKHQFYALLLDNTAIHKSDEIFKYCDKMDIRLIWNVAYRPDFNGIETVWA